MTCSRLSANNWSASKLYDKAHPQQNIDRLMDEERFLECWRQCERVGMVSTRELAANSETQLWDAGQRGFNEMSRNLIVIGRRNRQVYLTDDDKIHCEACPSKHQNLPLKIIKHTADNRFGFVMDTVVTPGAMFIVNVQLQTKGRKQHDSLRNQLYNTFGSDALTVPSLENIEFHGDRGYFSEQSFLSILQPTGCMFTCTCPQGNWLPFALGKPTVALCSCTRRIIVRICGMQRLDRRHCIRQIVMSTRRLALAILMVRNMSLLHLLQQPRLPIKLGQIVAEHLLQRMVLHP